MSATEQDFVASFAEAVDADVAVGTDDQEREKRVFLVTPGELEVKSGSHDVFWLSAAGIEAIHQLEIASAVGREIVAVVGTGRRFRQTLSYLRDYNSCLRSRELRVIRTPLCGGPEMIFDGGKKVLLADQTEYSTEDFCGISAIGPDVAWALVNQWLELTSGDLLICAEQDFMTALGWRDVYRPAVLYKLDPIHNWADEVVS